MSVLSIQIKTLRETAREFEGYGISRLLLDAADTIESLRERLQDDALRGECEIVYDGELWWKCERCGERWRQESGVPSFCPCCGWEAVKR